MRYTLLMKYLIAGIAAIIIICAAYWFLVPYAEAPLTSEENTQTMHLTVTSPVFKHDASIPAKYTCDADNVSPPLRISGIPDGTVSLAILMDDPDVPKQLKPDGVFDHWVVYSIPVSQGQTTVEIPEAATVGAFGVNGRGSAAYTGPCPPPEYQPTEHRYFFKVYALSTELSFFKEPTKAEVAAALTGNILAEGELVGRYARLPQHGITQ